MTILLNFIIWGLIMVQLSFSGENKRPNSKNLCPPGVQEIIHNMSGNIISLIFEFLFAYQFDEIFENCIIAPETKNLFRMQYKTSKKKYGIGSQYYTIF